MIKGLDKSKYEKLISLSWNLREHTDNLFSILEGDEVCGRDDAEIETDELADLIKKIDKILEDDPE